MNNLDTDHDISQNNKKTNENDLYCFQIDYNSDIIGPIYNKLTENKSTYSCIQCMNEYSVLENNNKYNHANTKKHQKMQMNIKLCMIKYQLVIIIIITSMLIIVIIFKIKTMNIKQL